MKLQFRRRTDVGTVLPVVRRQFAAGRLIAYPTETTYGIGAGLDDAGLDAIKALKGRDDDKPLIVLVSSLTMLREWGFDLTSQAEALAATFWPGPLTLVLPNRDIRLPRRLRGPSSGVGVRWTSHAGTTSLIEGLGHPLISTSANIASERPAMTADEVANYFPRAFAERQLEILDGGALVSHLPSTVVDATGELTILREGALTREQLTPYLRG